MVFHVLLWDNVVVAKDEEHGLSFMPKRRMERRKMHICVVKMVEKVTNRRKREVCRVGKLVGQ